MKRLLLIIAAFASAVNMYSDEIISKFYYEQRPEKEVIVLNYSEAVEASLLLVETNDIEEGTYKVEVTRKATHIYKIEETGIYIKMPYCYEYSIWDKAILKVEKVGSKLVGNLSWIKD